MRIIVTNSHSPASETIMMQSVTRSNEVWHASHPADDKIRLRVRPAWFSSFERLKNSTRIVSFILFASSDTSLNLCIYKKKKIYNWRNRWHPFLERVWSFSSEKKETKSISFRDWTPAKVPHFEKITEYLGSKKRRRRAHNVSNTFMSLTLVKRLCTFSWVMKGTTRQVDRLLPSRRRPPSRLCVSSSASCRRSRESRLNFKQKCNAVPRNRHRLEFTILLNNNYTTCSKRFSYQSKPANRCNWWRARKQLIIHPAGFFSIRIASIYNLGHKLFKLRNNR